MLLRLFFIACFTLLSGCTSSSFEEDPVNVLLLGSLVDDVVVPEPEELALYLTDDIRQTITESIDPEWSQLRRFRALREHLFDESGRDIQYDAAATLTASEAYLSGKGNCLSISNLFVASARLLGIESRFETVSVMPTWETVGSMMVRYEHIVAAGELHRGDEYTVDFLPDLADRSNTRRRVSDHEALALYFNNRGADAVLEGRYEDAVVELHKAIRLWPENSDVWSNLGATYRRKGASRLAEASYKRALALDRNNYSALANLTQFYIFEDREEEAQDFVARVHRYYRRNPYYFYYLARLAYNSGKYEDALAFLGSAVRLKRDEKEFYLAMADTYRRMGDEENANELTAYAEKVKPRPSIRTGVRAAFDRGIRLSR